MSSGVTLTAATRQNLLSLQGTADLLSSTQNRLSTGKKVNSALDDPTSFFTSQSLSGRSGDLGSLLNGISNGVQTIQAANQGITSIQKLVDSAKSTANQALADKSATTSGTRQPGHHLDPEAGRFGQVHRQPGAGRQERDHQRHPRHRSRADLGHRLPGHHDGGHGRDPELRDR
ncbi:hypothetical protein ASF39_19805 [Methylobacterium sp. Leaf108]|nr:hypothetical protein ASF39_19805 [Methylobacterium sp. Leaf108]